MATIRLGVRQLNLATVYQGFMYDQVLNVFFAQARIYDPTIRRFHAVDPVRGWIVEPQTMVQYTFLLNNPLRYIDPLGLSASKVGVAAFASGAGATVGSTSSGGVSVTHGGRTETYRASDRGVSVGADGTLMIDARRLDWLFDVDECVMDELWDEIDNSDWNIFHSRAIAEMLGNAVAVIKAEHSQNTQEFQAELTQWQQSMARAREQGLVRVGLDLLANRPVAPTLSIPSHVLARLNQEMEELPLYINNIWDHLTIHRIGYLHPATRNSVIAFILDAQSQGIYLRLTSGYRSIAEQDNLFAQGRTTAGNIVTHVRGGHSFHNFGLALDVVEILDGRLPPRTEDLLWENENWELIGTIGESHGFEWGGRWIGFLDRLHFEMTFGYTTAQLCALPRGDGFVVLDTPVSVPSAQAPPRCFCGQIGDIFRCIFK
jgi:RHS repeat-associated protein